MPKKFPLKFTRDVVAVARRGLGRYRLRGPGAANPGRSARHLHVSLGLVPLSLAEDLAGRAVLSRQSDVAEPLSSAECVKPATQP